MGCRPWVAIVGSRRQFQFQGPEMLLAVEISEDAHRCLGSEPFRTYEKYVSLSQDSYSLCSIWAAWTRLDSQGSCTLAVK